MTRSQTRSLKLLALAALAGFVLTACAQPYRTGPKKSTSVPPPPAGVDMSAPSPSGAAPAPARAPDTGSAQYRADLESCFSFARARIARDEQMEADSSAAFDAYPQGLGMGEIRSRMSKFANRNRRSKLNSDCMRAKGYSQN